MLDTCPPLGDVVIPTSFLVHPIIAGDHNYVLRDPLFEFKKVGPDATHLMALHLNLNSGTQVQWDPLFKFKKKWARMLLTNWPYILDQTLRSTPAVNEARYNTT
jgi:hypothetical protein